MKELLGLFLKLGCFGFGGPIATISMMEDEFVRRRQWLTAEKFQQIYALIKVLPGPTATQMAIHLGKLRAGKFAGFLCGVLFIFPAFLIVLLLSHYYQMSNMMPQSISFFSGLQLAALAIIFESVLRLSQPMIKNKRSLFLILLSGVLVFLHPGYEPLFIIGSGILGIMLAGWQPKKAHLFFFMPTFFQPTVLPEEAWKLFSVCLKAGALVFGTGLAIVPMLEADFVTKHQWVTHTMFLDGLAIGQMTPGPVVITATFLGYQVLGVVGAVLATIGVFSPSFINILIVVPLFEKRIESWKHLKTFTEWAFPVVVGGICAALYKLSVLSMTDPYKIVMFVVGVVILWKKRMPVWAWIPLAGVLQILLSRFI